MFLLVQLAEHLFIVLFFFFFNDTATTEIYTLSLHDALPILHGRGARRVSRGARRRQPHGARSEEHTSELQSLTNLVCRLLLEKKNKAQHLQQMRSAAHLRKEAVAGKAHMDNLLRERDRLQSLTCFFIMILPSTKPKLFPYATPFR